MPIPSDPNPSPIEVRRAVSADAPRLAVLGLQVWLHTYAVDGISQPIADYVLAQFSIASMAGLLARPSMCVWVAESGANLAGYATVESGAVCPSDATATQELTTLYVQSHAAGRGIGAQLLHAAESGAPSSDGSALWLRVNARNAPAIAFYQRHGYAKVGTTHFELGASRHENDVMVGPMRTPR